MYVPAQKIEGLVKKGAHMNERPCNLYVRVNPSEKRWEASNGKALVAIPLELEEGEKATEHFFSPTDITRARKATGGRPRLSSCQGGVITLADGSTLPLQTPGRTGWPDFNSATPEPGNRPPDLCIDSGLLLTLAKGLSGSKDNPGYVGLWFKKTDEGYDFNAAIYVRPFNGDGYGAIMPLSRPDKDCELKPHNSKTDKKVRG